MNIFFLDLDIEKCAQYHCDRHVTKMQLEHTQMLCTAVNFHNGKQIEGLYKSAHLNHPCTKWVRENKSNFELLYRLTKQLNIEQFFRFGTTHKSITVADEAYKYIHLLPDGELTKKPMAMPEAYRVNNVVHSYRTYYNRDKQHIAVWTKRPIPEWFVKKR